MNKQEIELNIELLKGNVDGFKVLLSEQPDHPMGGSIEYQIDALEMAISALEKQKSKSPIQNQDDGIWECPECESQLDDVYDYCPRCGQKLMNDEMEE